MFAVYFFRKPERNRVGQGVIISAGFLALVLAPVVFRAANMWLPAEKIVLKNEPAIVGYVLAADPRYATVLKAADSTVQILELDDVESRTICRLNPGLESASFPGISPALPRNTRPVLGDTARKAMDRRTTTFRPVPQVKDQAVYVVMVTMIIA